VGPGVGGDGSGPGLGGVGAGGGGWGVGAGGTGVGDGTSAVMAAGVKWAMSVRIPGLPRPHPFWPAPRSLFSAPAAGYATTMRLLVLTTEAVSAEQLRDALPGDADPTDAEVMVVAPALHDSALRFWLSDADDAIARADEVRRQSAEQLGAEGVSAAADTGESDPEDAVEDVLKTFPADRILVFTHTGDEQRYREDVDTDALQSRFGIPVTQARL
jgi:hypothetical protein